MWRQELQDHCRRWSLDLCHDQRSLSPVTDQASQRNRGVVNCLSVFVCVIIPTSDPGMEYIQIASRHQCCRCRRLSHYQQAGMVVKATRLSVLLCQLGRSSVGVAPYSQEEVPSSKPGWANKYYASTYIYTCLYWLLDCALRCRSSVQGIRWLFQKDKLRWYRQMVRWQVHK